jgi:hypothetical protein
MNLRKTGRLSDLPRSKRTAFTESERDRCAFACEIAIQSFHEQGCSLDHLLCDPEQAVRFDVFVRSIVGKDLPSLLMRWVAFGIRKRAQSVRKRAASISETRLRLPSQRILATQLEISKIPCSSGLYWLQNAAEQRNLYVGETLNLQKRLETQIIDSVFDFWGTSKDQLVVRIKEENAENLSGYQSYWIGHWKPQGNYFKLAAI